MKQKTSFQAFREELAALSQPSAGGAQRSVASTAPTTVSEIFDGVGLPSMLADLELPLCEGGLSSISPSSKIQTRVLSSGIDTLVLAFDITWPDQMLFDLLAGKKASAKAAGADELVKIALDDVDFIALGVHGTGIRGFEWVLSGPEYMLQVGNSLKPTTRPSMMVEVRSECLWRFGPGKAVERVLQWIATRGGVVTSCKVSRVDLCVDLMLPSEIWKAGAYDQVVTYSTKNGLFFDGLNLEGMKFGKGGIVGRIYDKWREIQSSGKLWFMDVWKCNGPDDGAKIIRVEYQIRREQIKEFGVDQWTDLADKLPSIWGYLSGSWLQMVDDRSKDTARQTVAPWWQVVRLGFTGAQLGAEAVRVRACRAQKKQMIQQIFGLASAVAALDCQDDLPTWWDVGAWFKQCAGFALDYKLGPAAFKTKVSDKGAKYLRGRLLDQAPYPDYIAPGFTWGPSGLEHLIHVSN